MGYKHVSIKVGKKHIKAYLTWTDLELLQRYSSDGGHDSEFAKYVLFLALKHHDDTIELSAMDHWIGEMPGEFLSDKGEYISDIVKKLTGMDQNEQQEKDGHKKKSDGMISSSSGSVSDSKEARSGSIAHSKPISSSRRTA